MYDLCPARISRGIACEKCHRRPTQFVFMGQRYHRWQLRCYACALAMVQAGKAKWPKGSMK